MSDSGFSQFPTKPPPTAGLNILNLRGDLKAQVIEISGKIARLATPQTVTGEITKVNRDGTVQVRTEDGEMTLKPRERLTPTEGQKLQIDLPAGAPPKQVTLRPAPTSTPPISSTPTPVTNAPVTNAPVTNAPVMNTPAPSTSVDSAPTRPPLDPQVQAHLNLQQAARPAPTSALPLQAPLPSPQPILPDALLRLSLLPQAQIRDYLTQIIQSLPTPIPMRLTTLARLPGDTLIPTLPQAPGKGLITVTPEILRPVITQMPEGQRPLILSGLPAISSTESFPRQQSLLGTLITAPTPGISSGETSAPTALFNRISLQPPQLMPGTIAPTPLLSIPKLTPLIMSPLLSSSALPAVRIPSSLDVRVQAVHPPGLTLIAPALSGEGQKITPALTFNPPAPSLLQPGLVTQPITAPQLTGHVIGLTTRHTPVIMMPLPQTGETAFFTASITASNLIPGTSLLMMPQPGTIAPPSTLPGTPPSVFELMSGFRWPVFDELAEIQNLQIQAVTAQTLAQIMPSPAQPAKLPAAALLFIAAVRAGDLQAWLGEKAIDSLRRSGKAEWVARMSREFSGLNKLVAEPVSADWRGVSIPLYAHGQIEKIHLYYRSSDHGHDRDQEQEDKGTSTRFIFDLHLTAIGPLQLDGYVRGKVLDLAVRTERPFSMAMRHDMTQRYIHTLEVAGLEGALIFQSQPDKWVHITPRADLLRTSI